MAEIGRAARIEMDDLAVDQRGGNRQLGEPPDERRKLFRPIEGVAGQELRLLVADPGEQPIAVIFDLVKPLEPVRRLIDRGC